MSDNRKNSNLAIKAGTTIPVPPIPEQHRIVAELDVLQAEVDALKRLQAETATELDALLPSILTKLSKENYEYHGHDSLR